MGNGVRHTWVLILIVLFRCDITLLGLLNISEPYFPHLEIRVIIAPLHRLVLKIKWDNPCKELSTVLPLCKRSGKSYYFLLESIKCLPDSYLTAQKILCPNFQACQKLDPTVTSPVLPGSQQGMYTKSACCESLHTMHTHFHLWIFAHVISLSWNIWPHTSILPANPSSCSVLVPTGLTVA
jgi:hypothetical protein